jgi:hypothetical protein
VRGEDGVGGGGGGGRIKKNVCECGELGVGVCIYIYAFASVCWSLANQLPQVRGWSQREFFVQPSAVQGVQASLKPTCKLIANEPAVPLGSCNVH